MLALSSALSPVAPPAWHRLKVAALSFEITIYFYFKIHFDQLVKVQFILPTGLFFLFASTHHANYSLHFQIRKGINYINCLPQCVD